MRADGDAFAVVWGGVVAFVEDECNVVVLVLVLLLLLLLLVLVLVLVLVLMLVLGLLRLLLPRSLRAQSTLRVLPLQLIYTPRLPPTWSLRMGTESRCR